MDYLKSIFILLMIIFHIVYIGDKYPYLKSIVYTFHMSSFLVISGYLINTHKDARTFLRTMLWIFIPYAFMELGYVITSSVLDVRERVAEVTPLLLAEKVFVKPIGPYWYLHTLLLCSMVWYGMVTPQKKHVALHIDGNLFFFHVSLSGTSFFFKRYLFYGGSCHSSKRSFFCNNLSTQ